MLSRRRLAVGAVVYPPGKACRFRVEVFCTLDTALYLFEVVLCSRSYYILEDRSLLSDGGDRGAKIRKRKVMSFLAVSTSTVIQYEPNYMSVPEGQRIYEFTILYRSFSSPEADNHFRSCLVCTICP